MKKLTAALMAASFIPSSALAFPTNYKPPYKSYLVTGNPADIVPSTTIATDIGNKVDATNGQSTGQTLQNVTVTGGTESGVDISADTITPTGATTSNTSAGWLSQTVLVTQFGADPTGVADSTTAFVSAIKSNRRIVVPPGTYRIATQTEPASTATDASAIYIAGQSHFSIEGYGATLVLDPSIAFSLVLNLTADSDFSVKGLKFSGSRSGLTIDQENAAIQLFNSENFDIRDLDIDGFAGNGTAFVGDWIANGAISNINVTHTSMCADVAFLYNVKFSHFHAVGDGSVSGDGSAPGNKCFSVIYDTPFASSGALTETYSNTHSLTFSENNVSNYETGVLLENGDNIRVVNNNIHGNPGYGSAEGLGIYLNYASSTDEGHPLSDVEISGNYIGKNGATVAGAGITINNSALANSDVFQNFNINNNVFDSNASVGIYSTATAQSTMPALTISGNQYYGSAQTPISPILADFAGVYEYNGPTSYSYSNPALHISGTQTDTASVMIESNSGGYGPTITPSSNTTSLTNLDLNIYALGTGEIRFYKPIQTASYTVSALPSSPEVGARAHVTDATACTFMTTLTGGGSVTCPAFYNGSSWVAE